MKKFSFIVNGHVKTADGIAILKPTHVAMLNGAAEICSELQEAIRQAATLRIEQITTQPTLLVYRAREDN